MDVRGKSLIRFPELQKKLGLSRTTIYRLQKSEDFPKFIRLGRRSVGWILSDVENWISKRMAGEIKEMKDERKV